MRKSIRISVDIDGVISNFTSNAAAVANQMWPGKIPSEYEPSSWDFADVLTKEEWEKVWAAIKITPYFWSRQEEYLENVKALRDYLKLAGILVYFITSRVETIGLNAEAQSTHWLKIRGLKNYWQKDPQVIVSKSENKFKLMNQHNIAMSIDDKAETVEQCNSLNGHRAFLLDRPYNRNSKEPRVYSMAEFLEKVKFAE